MILLYGAVFLCYFALFILSYRKKKSLVKCSKKSWEKDNRYGIKEGIFGDMANYIYEVLLKGKMLHQKDVNESLFILYPEIGGKEEKKNSYLRQFYIYKIRLWLFIVFAGNILAFCLWIGSRAESAMTEGRYISRNAHGMGSRELNLQVKTKDKTEKNRQDIVLTVEEQGYEEAVVKNMAKEISILLPDTIRGMNASLEEVRDKLDLVSEVKGYPFRIGWESDNYARIYPDGTVMNEDVGAKGEIVNLTAAITYGNYKEEHIIPVHVFPPDYSEEEVWKKKIYDMLTSQEEKNRYEERMELPESIEGEKLIWSEKIEDNSGYLFLLICVGAGAVYLLQERRLREKVEDRNRQMLMDYPQLISKLMLYLGAGMTIRNAFQRIAAHYHKEKQEGGDYRYVYEEMLLACHELDGGISEASAYEHFGKRCRLPQYTKLVNILIQNLRKGSSGILDALRQEAKNAFEERKNMARKLGEEAGTKLLLPMMLMLGIVMILIIIPAYFSFSL